MSGLRRGGSSPSVMWRSVRQTPQARTLMRTWPGPGVGRATSSISSLCPGVVRIAARVFLLQILHRNIELRRIHHALALKLHPHAIHTLAREVNIELHLGPAIRNERMRVNHVDQIVARGQHVS